MTVAIACAADAAYLPHCAAMLHSAAALHGSALEAHFLHAPGMDASLLDALQAMLRAQGAQLHTHAIADSEVAGLPEMERIPRVMWYRALLPQLLPAHERVLYVDADTLITDRLDPLWTMNLDDAWVAAVDNVIERRHRDHAAHLGLPPQQRLFNSGVLLLNLDRMRRDDCTRRLLAYARQQGPRLLWPDQDALNVVLGSRRLRLHPRWNCQNSLWYLDERADVFSAREIREARTQPGILHFEGPTMFKPWTWTCRHPWRAQWRAHRSQTPWPLRHLRPADAWDIPLRTLPLRWLPWLLRLRHRFASVS